MVYWQSNYLKITKFKIQRMLLLIIKKIFLLNLLFFVGLFGLPVFAAETSPDAIAIRVMPNPDHFSPISWYNRNVNIKGAPQSLIVDGYEAVRDGRTVYVNAGNLSEDSDDAVLYTNIYIISYNQEAESDTKDIFGQILNYWKFNIELVDRTGSGICLPQQSITCEAAVGCVGEAIDSACENNLCVKKCLLSSDCQSGQYCASEKAKLVRDVKRLSDLREIRVAFNNYHLANGHYPELPAGSYLPNKSLSVWPSWNDTLGKALGYRLPLDPVNRLGPCHEDEVIRDNYDRVTCWDENSKTFATSFRDPYLPLGSLAMLYDYDDKADRYKLCVNFETPYQGLPDVYRCDAYMNDFVVQAPQFIFGSLVSKEGSFQDYFSVRGTYPVNWATFKLTANWADWFSRGWQWHYGFVGLRVEKVPNGDENTRSLGARLVNLPGEGGYENFDFQVEVTDIYGNTGSADGQIRICNLASCQSKGAECGRTGDNCGGILLCGECRAGLDCVANKCIQL